MEIKASIKDLKGWLDIIERHLFFEKRRAKRYTNPTTLKFRIRKPFKPSGGSGFKDSEEERVYITFDLDKECRRLERKIMPSPHKDVIPIVKAG